MARRRLPKVIPPVKDSSVSVEEMDFDPSTDPKDKVSPKNKLRTEMSAHQFNAIIRYIKQSDIEGTKALRTASYNRLRALGFSRNEIRSSPVAAKGLPKGSDQLTIGSVTTWMEKVTATDVAALEQLATIYGTANARIHA